jgi:hypothetical protein
MLLCSLCCLQVLVSILTNGEKQRGMATLVEGDLGHTEEALIQVRVTETYSCATAKTTTEIAAYLFFFPELMASIYYFMVLLFFFNGIHYDGCIISFLKLYFLQGKNGDICQETSTKLFVPNKPKTKYRP